MHGPDPIKGASRHGPDRRSRRVAPPCRLKHAKGLLTDPPRNAKGRTVFNDPFEDCEAVAKPELGTKRLCAHCGAKFYDLNHSPINCPKCGVVFEPVAVTSRGRPEAARVPVREVEAVVPETQEAEFVSLEEADAEAQGKKKPTGDAPAGDDDVELDDEALDDAAFIEETEEEDADVTEIIGGDIENEEET
jgi:uncharacterized protein (TIGR02300 family)